MDEFQSEGNVEFSLDGSTWGTICSDGFDLVSARVACRQLGFNYEEANYHSVNYNSTESDSPVLFTQVKCRGGESDLKECSIQNLKNETKCKSSEIVYLNCNATGGPHSNFNDNIRLGLPVADGVGLVEIRNGSQWELVCSTDFSPTVASIACKQLGYQYANAVPVQTYLLANSKQRIDRPRFIRSLDCNGNETTLNECRSKSCHTDQVTISCVGSEIESATDPQKLLIAIAMNNVSEVERLLTSGLSPNSEMERCCSEKFDQMYFQITESPVLLCAVCYGSFGSVKALLRHGADPNELGLSGVSAWHYAARFGDFEMFKYLTENCGDSSGELLLYDAATGGSVEIIEYLIQRGMSLEYDYHLTLLILASIDGHVDMARFLVDHGENVNFRTSEDEMTAMAYAVKNRHFKFLIISLPMEPILVV